MKRSLKYPSAFGSLTTTHNIRALEIFPRHAIIPSDRVCAVCVCVCALLNLGTFSLHTQTPGATVCVQVAGKMLKRWWCVDVMLWKQVGSALCIGFTSIYNFFFSFSLSLHSHSVCHLFFLFHLARCDSWKVLSTFLSLWKCFLKHIKNTSALMHIISNSVDVFFSRILRFFPPVKSSMGFLLWSQQIWKWKRCEVCVCVFGRVQFKNITTIHTQMHARSTQNICVFVAKISSQKNSEIIKCIRKITAHKMDLCRWKMERQGDRVRANEWRRESEREKKRVPKTIAMYGKWFTPNDTIWSSLKANRAHTQPFIHSFAFAGVHSSIRRYSLVNMMFLLETANLSHLFRSLDCTAISLFIVCGVRRARFADALKARAHSIPSRSHSWHIKHI